MSSLQQNWRKGQNRFCLEAREWGEEVGRQGGEMAQSMCAHLNKIIQKKINKVKKKKRIFYSGSLVVI
jgi:hypothetical protein